MKQSENLVQKGLTGIRTAFEGAKKALSFGDALTFKGGIHPDYMKENTANKPIIDLPGSEIMVYPMQQHIGAAAQPCVNVGDRVLMGQKIGEAQGFVSANIFSSVSGTVEAVEPRPHPNGTKVMSVVVANDGEDELHPDIKPRDNVEGLSPKEIVDIVREAGIVGMGGATFPTHVKLSPPSDKKIEYVIVNGAECEPYLTSDHRAMLETAGEIMAGLKLVMKVFGLKTGYIGIEDNKADAIANLQDWASREEDVEIKVIKLKTKYPQGSEKHLIKAVTGRAVPPGKLPMDVGAIVDNVDTVAAIARAVYMKTPLMRRIVTVSGDCIQNPSNFRVRIGTSIDFVIEKSGVLKKTPAKVIMGGPMMGIALTDTNVPVIKGSSGVLAFGAALSKSRTAGNCLRCAKCVNACPMSLLPNVLKTASIAADMEKLEKLNVKDCIGCGSCTYVCPTEQNPLQYIKSGKAQYLDCQRRADN